MKLKQFIIFLKASLIISLTILLVSVLFGMFSLSAAPLQAQSKISPHLLNTLKNGETVEFFVILSNKAELSESNYLKTKTEKGNYVYQNLWQTAQTEQASLKNWLTKQKITYQSFYIVNALLVQGDYTLALTLANRSDVIRLESNPKIYNQLPSITVQTTQKTSATIESNLIYLNADDVWDLGFTGQNIVIGGQDTGYDWEHPALNTQYRGSNGANVDHNYNWHDSIHSNDHGSNTCGFDSLEPCDDYGHGTHTIGTAVGDDGTVNQIGMAPNAEWVGCRNMDNGWGSPASYLECFEFFLAPYPLNGTPADGLPDLAPDVTVNSWSCPADEGCSWDTLQEAIQAQAAAGILTVAAAGNEGSNCSSVATPPGIYQHSYTVGALVKNTDTLASFSGRGPVTVDGSNRRKPDIVAPGTNIYSSYPGGSYGPSQGTSMATPHVAGAVALLWSAVPPLTNNITATINYLNQTAVPIQSTDCNSNGWPNNAYGYGRLDILAATQKALIDFNLLAPQVSFSYQEPIYLNKTITFTNLTTGVLPISSTWNFGDGTSTISTGTTLNPVQHVYTNSGTYTVWLTATNSTALNAVSQTITVYQAGIQLSPITSTQVGSPYISARHVFTLTNTGGWTDTIQLTVNAQQLPLPLLSITQTTLAPSAQMQLIVRLPFPYSSTLPIKSTVILTATSLNVPTKFATATLISSFVDNGSANSGSIIYLPLIVKK